MSITWWEWMSFISSNTALISLVWHCNDPWAWSFPSGGPPSGTRARFDAAPPHFKLWSFYRKEALSFSKNTFRFLRNVAYLFRDLRAESFHTCSVVLRNLLKTDFKIVQTCMVYCKPLKFQNFKDHTKMFTATEFAYSSSLLFLSGQRVLFKAHNMFSQAVDLWIEQREC